MSNEVMSAAMEAGQLTGAGDKLMFMA